MCFIHQKQKKKFYFRNDFIHTTLDNCVRSVYMYKSIPIQHNHVSHTNLRKNQKKKNLFKQPKTILATHT